MHAFFCAVSFILVYFLYPETRGVPLEEMDRYVYMRVSSDHRLFGDEIVDFEEDEEEDEGSETSSLVRSGRNRSRSAHSSLPTSRKASPLPPDGKMSAQQSGVLDRLLAAITGRRRREASRGGYNAVDGSEQ